MVILGEVKHFDLNLIIPNLLNNDMNNDIMI